MHRKDRGNKNLCVNSEKFEKKNRWSWREENKMTSHRVTIGRQRTLEVECQNRSQHNLRGGAGASDGHALVPLQCTQRSTLWVESQKLREPRWWKLRLERQRKATPQLAEHQSSGGHNRFRIEFSTVLHQPNPMIAHALRILIGKRVTEWRRSWCSYRRHFSISSGQFHYKFKNLSSQ